MTISESCASKIQHKPVRRQKLLQSVKKFQSIISDLPTIPHPEQLRESEVPTKYIISVQDMEKCLIGIKQNM